MTGWVSLLLLCAVTGYFVVGWVIFAIGWFRGRRPIDREVLARHASPLLGRHLRHYLMWMLAPYERALVRLGVSPELITFASLVSAAGAGVALCYGAFGLGGWLYLVAGILDIFDGRVARATGRSSHVGAYLDSVVDRYAELFVLAGLACYYRDSWRIWLPFAAALGSIMVSYTRARGEALGVDVRVGTMQRPERLFYLGMVVALAPLWEAIFHRGGGARPIYLPVVVVLVLLSVSSHVTALRRIVHTVRALRGPQPERTARPMRLQERLLALLRTAG